MQPQKVVFCHECTNIRRHECTNIFDATNTQKLVATNTRKSLMPRMHEYFECHEFTNID